MYNSFVHPTSRLPDGAPNIDVNEKTHSSRGGVQSFLEMDLDEVDQAPMFRAQRNHLEKA